MSIADTFVATVTDGSLLLAVPVAAVAGLVSFLSPCVLPLVPGYLSFVTGLSGEQLAEAQRRRPAEGDTLVRTRAPVRRSRVLAGSVLFVLGFSAVFVTSGALFGSLGSVLAGPPGRRRRRARPADDPARLAFLGLVPGLQREVRLHRLPSPGLAGAPLLGVLFGVGWTPCLGPDAGGRADAGLPRGERRSWRAADRPLLRRPRHPVRAHRPRVLPGDRRVRRRQAPLRPSSCGSAAGCSCSSGCSSSAACGASVIADLRGWVSGFETAV
jgi:cytochrome c-type biogenesis protein